MTIPPPLSHPEFWKKQGYPTFEKFWRVCNGVLEALNRFTLNAGAVKEKHHLLIRYLCMTVGVSYADVGLLVGNGCGLSAMKIVRSALEAAINAEYLRLEPAEHRQFLDWSLIEQHRKLEYMRRYMPTEYANRDPQKVANTEEKYAAVRPRFLQPNKKVRKSWCKLSLRERAEKTNFGKIYKTVYLIASELSHVSFGGLAQHVESFEEEGTQPAIPPSLTSCLEALQSAHYCALRAVETLVAMNEADSTPPLATLKSDYDDAWSE